MENLIIGGPYLSDELIESTLLEKNPIYTIYNFSMLDKLHSIAKDRELKKVKILVQTRMQGKILTQVELNFHNLRRIFFLEWILPIY